MDLAGRRAFSTGRVLLSLSPSSSTSTPAGPVPLMLSLSLERTAPSQVHHLPPLVSAPRTSVVYCLPALSAWGRAGKSLFADPAPLSAISKSLSSPLLVPVRLEGGPLPSARLPADALSAFFAGKPISLPPAQAPHTFATAADATTIPGKSSREFGSAD